MIALHVPPQSGGGLSEEAMRREMIKMTLDLSVPDNKRRLLSSVGILTGMYDVKLKPRRPTRSNRANAFYWAAVVTPFSQFLSESAIQRYTPEQCHDLLKCHILGEEPIPDPDTGEVVGHRLLDTHTMDTEAFFDYVDRCIAYLATEYGIIVAEPQPWRETIGAAS